MADPRGIAGKIAPYKNDHWCPWGPFWIIEHLWGNVSLFYAFKVCGVLMRVSANLQGRNVDKQGKTEVVCMSWLKILLFTSITEKVGKKKKSWQTG